MSVAYIGPDQDPTLTEALVTARASLPATNVLVAYDAWPQDWRGPFHAVRGAGGTWAYAIRHDVETIERSLILHKEPRASALRLDGWRLRTGTPWVGTPGTSGVAVLRSLWDRRAGGAPAPTWMIDPACGSQSAEWDQPNELDHTARDWSSAPERGALWVHEYDANAAYLAAAGVVPVAQWRLHARRPQDCRRPDGQLLPGLYLVELAPWHARPLPHPAGPAANLGGPVVLSHITLGLLDRLETAGVYGGYRIIAGNVCDKSTRLFRKWSETLRDMIYSPDRDDVSVACGKAAKAAYREAIGLMGRQEGRIYRPDWRAAIIAQARVTIWWRAWQIGTDTGRWPTAIHVDALRYASDYGDPIRAVPPHLPMRAARLGGFKVKRSQLLRGEK